MAKAEDWPLQGKFFLDCLLWAKRSDPSNTVAWNMQRIASDELNVASSTLNRWCSGETPIPENMFRLANRVITAQETPENEDNTAISQFETGYKLLQKIEAGTADPDQELSRMVREFLIEKDRLAPSDLPIVRSISPIDKKPAEDQRNRPQETSSHEVKDNHDDRPGLRHAHLPPQLPDFVGQQERMGLISQSLKQGQNVLVAGMGGVGKTTLSIEFAHRHLTEFSGGVFFADAQGMSRKPLPAVEVARLLSQAIDPVVQPGKGDNWINLLCEQLVSHESLLILDNLWSSDTLKAFSLPPSVRVLATARKRLAAPGCHILDLEEMAMNDAISLLRLVLHTLNFSDDLLEELANECGALPLALRAAATFIHVYKVPIQEYLDRLRTRRSEQNGQKLTYLSEARELDRALDVQAVLSLSLEKLLIDDRDLALKYLDLVGFAADFDVRVVTAIWELDSASTERALDRLVAQSLVQRELYTGRMRIHDLLKEMAEGQLVS